MQSSQASAEIFITLHLLLFLLNVKRPGNSKSSTFRLVWTHPSLLRWAREGDVKRLTWEMVETGPDPGQMSASKCRKVAGSIGELWIVLN